MPANEFNHAPFPEILGDQAVDPYLMFVASVPLMVREARRAARDDAFSYRGFTVGAALFALNSISNKTGIFSDGNWKMAPEFPKRCAEGSALREAKSKGYTAAIGVVIAATTNPDAIEGVTQKRTGTLHMCSVCINEYDASPLVNDNFLVITSGTETDGYQCHTLGEMKQFYAPNDSLDAPKERYYHHTNDFHAWHDRAALYDHLIATRPDAGSDSSRAELARMVLSAAFLPDSSNTQA